MLKGSNKNWMDAIVDQKEVEMAELAKDTSAFDLLEHGVNRSEAVKLAKESLDFLAMLAIPAVFVYNFPLVLQSAWQLLLKYAQYNLDFPQLALGIPRGHGKTALIKLYILWCILFGKTKFILVIGSTAALAENIIADVAAMLNEPNIIAVFGDWKLSQEVDRQNLKKFGFRGRNIVIAAIGAGGALRGMNVGNERPDMIVFDDVQTKECSESPVESASLERWMIGTAMKAKSPAGCTFIFAGNMYPGTNSILKKLKSNATWIKFISGAILADGTALWPELRPLDSLIKELDNDIAMGHPEIFFSEVMNDTEAGINTQVDFSKVASWPYSNDDLPQGKFIIIDPAGEKKRSDMTAIGYFEMYDGVPGLVRIVEKKLSPGNTIREALLLALQTDTKIIAVEGTGYQASLLYWFVEVCKTIGIEGIQCVEVYPGTTSKNGRIATMLTALTAKEVLLHTNVRSQVLHQISNWNSLKRDNVDGLLDLLTYAPAVIKNYGVACLCDTDSVMLNANAMSVLDNVHMF